MVTGVSGRPAERPSVMATADTQRAYHVGFHGNLVFARQLLRGLIMGSYVTWGLGAGRPPPGPGHLARGGFRSVMDEERRWSMVQVALLAPNATEPVTWTVANEARAVDRLRRSPSRAKSSRRCWRCIGCASSLPFTSRADAARRAPAAGGCGGAPKPVGAVSWRRYFGDRSWGFQAFGSLASVAGLHRRCLP